nr:hypothetical protein [Tanacetum cinerariifolium]
MEVDMIKNDEALGVNLDLLEENESKQQFQKQEAKSRWRNTITQGSAAQASVQETSSTRTMKQAVRKIEGSSNLSGKDRMKSQKHWVKEHTSLETTTEIPFYEHGTSATLRNFIRMKCKYLSRAKKATKRALLKFTLL